VEAPRQRRSAADEQEEITITRREYEGEDVVAVDFGTGVDAKVDVGGDAAIVVAGDREFEFEVLEAAIEVTTNDGILVIRT
jgi:hypothetical protein